MRTAKEVAMFDVLMQNPVITLLPPLLSVVFGIILSRTIELVPKFAVWWAKQSDVYKRAYRGWAGLVLSVILVVFGYFTDMIQVSLASASDWLVLIAAVIISWMIFIGSAESTYQLTVRNLPRKQAGWSG
jgi:hypothetical protein